MGNQKRNFGKLVSSIKYPLVTEKSVKLYENQLYTFLVEKSLSKIEIKEVFEKVFNVKILSVKTMILPKKWKGSGKNKGSKPIYKKALLKVAKDQEIPNIFE